jgi:hypothetical protein
VLSIECLQLITMQDAPMSTQSTLLFALSLFLGLGECLGLNFDLRSVFLPLSILLGYHERCFSSRVECLGLNEVSAVGHLSMTFSGFLLFNIGLFYNFC